MDMCTVMCMDVCTGMCTDMCTGMCVRMCIDMCSDTGTDMCRDMFGAVFIRMCRYLPGCGCVVIPNLVTPSEIDSIHRAGLRSPFQARTHAHVYAHARTRV